MAPRVQPPRCTSLTSTLPTIGETIPQASLLPRSSHSPVSPLIIEVSQGICAETSIPPANHSALRSGFAGQPLNPRWTATKVVAWKTGREWRQALSQGKMVVRPSDSLLIPHPDLDVKPAGETEAIPTDPTPSSPKTIAKPHGLFCFLPARFGWS